MVFGDFKIGGIFSFQEQLWVVVSLITAIGAIEATDSKGQIRFFDYLDYKLCGKEA